MNRLPALLLTAAFSLCTALTASAQSPFAPVQDDPALPRVLLIGDSISIGYTVPVQKLLKGKANVHRIPVNGRFSAFGLANVKKCLGDGKWDVIHFNWGIWDTHMLDEQGALIRARDEGVKKGTIRTPIAEYRKNLDAILDILEPTGAELIWASSTPLTCVKGDRLKDIDRYNAAAADVMETRGVVIDDLNARIKPRLGEMQSKDGCHFTPKGYDYLGKQVADTILAALDPPDNPFVTWIPERTGEQPLKGRRVVPFEHTCLKEWGHAGKTKQYCY